jgi:hypothetical protein
MTITMSHSQNLSDHRRKASILDFSSHLKHVAGQVPAIVLICMFHLMTAIPFGVSYFPVGAVLITVVMAAMAVMKHHNPLIVMTVMTTSERFHYRKGSLWHSHVSLPPSWHKSSLPSFHSPNPIGLQMNVPFCHELAFICIASRIRHGGIIHTLFMFGLASVFVGIVFYVLEIQNGPRRVLHTQSRTGWMHWRYRPVHCQDGYGSHH